jgi:hypothetical protein
MEDPEKTAGVFLECSDREEEGGGKYVWGNGCGRQTMAPMMSTS